MIKTARDYHHATSYDRHNMRDHFMDWQHPPMPHKHYPGLAKTPLADVPPPTGSSLWALAAGPVATAETPPPDLKRLSQILGLAYGVTAERRQGRQRFHLRSAPSAGALYPIEIYLGAYQVPDLPAGLYHYSLQEKALATLRSGDLRRWVPPGPDGRSPQQLAVSFYLSAIFFRSAWKYTRRAFRYVLLDGGHVLENLRLALATAGFGCEILYDFDDEGMGHLLGLDARREVCLAAVNVYGPSATPLAADQTGGLKALPPAVQGGQPSLVPGDALR